MRLLYRHRNGCKGVAFYLKTHPASGEVVSSFNVVKLDGSRPMPGEAIICGTCGSLVVGFSTFNIEESPE